MPKNDKLINTIFVTKGEPYYKSKKVYSQYIFLLNQGPKAYTIWLYYQSDNT